MVENCFLSSWSRKNWISLTTVSCEFMPTFLCFSINVYFEAGHWIDMNEISSTNNDNTWSFILLSWWSDALLIIPFIYICFYMECESVYCTNFFVEQRQERKHILDCVCKYFLSNWIEYGFETNPFRLSDKLSGYWRFYTYFYDIW